MKKFINWIKNEFKLLRKINFNKTEVLVFDTEKQYDKYMDKLNKETSVIFDSVYNYYMNELIEDKQKQMFHDWWHGESVCKDEYQRELGISEELAYDTHSCILEACSRGFG